MGARGITDPILPIFDTRTRQRILLNLSNTSHRLRDVFDKKSDICILSTYSVSEDLKSYIPISTIFRYDLKALFVHSIIPIT